MNYPAAELRGIKVNFYLINPDAEHRGSLLIKKNKGTQLAHRKNFSFLNWKLPSYENLRQKVMRG